MDALSSSSVLSFNEDVPGVPALMREAFNSSENAGCNAESVTTTNKRTDSHEYLHSSSLDHLDQVSESSNLPDTPVDYISDDLELDVKPICHGATACDHQHDSGSDDMFASRLDELLQADIPQEYFKEEVNLTSVDDLIQSPQSMGQDCSLLDGMYAWSVESLRGLEAFPFQEDKLSLAESVSYGSEDESASQMFARWLQSNAHWISLSDLRKIKLKTSTIEDATRRLGGGKKGLMAFLKFVLMWVQNSGLKPSRKLDEALAPASEVHTRASLVSGCVGPSSVNDDPRDPYGRGHVHNLTSPVSPLMVAPSCPDWMSRARWGQPPLVDHSGAPSISNGHTYRQNGGSPLPSAEFYHSSCSWVNHANMLGGGISPSSLSACGSANAGQGAGLEKNATMMMLMQQQHCCDANPAATTRAARKNRMERQRWSVRHNRRWSASAHQSQHRLMTTASARGNSSCWSQALGNGLQDYPHSGAGNCQQQRIGRRSSLDLQQTYKRPEKKLRLLFQKELKQSDVGSLGRIVLPKAAETCLPPLELRDGLNLFVEDMISSKVWNMRYRFWPNNKSRMYLLENTTDFVKSYDLKEGDYMMLFCDAVTGKFVIRGAKGPAQAAPSSGKEGMECGNDVSILRNEGKRRTSSLQEEAESILTSTTNSEESCDEFLLAELIEQSLEDMKDI